MSENKPIITKDEFYTRIIKNQERQLEQLNQIRFRTGVVVFFLVMGAFGGFLSFLFSF